jgi:hypothetical protein
LPEEGVSSLLEYDDSLMLISTLTRVIIYNHLLKTKRYLGTSETLAGFIASMQKDSEGNVWIGTTANLCRADIRTRVFATFNRYDGYNDYFILNSANRLTDGRMLFGTSGDSWYSITGNRDKYPPPSITARFG